MLGMTLEEFIALGLEVFDCQLPLWQKGD